MSKYIVMNCPAYDKDEKLGYTCTLLTVEVAECKNCTGCLIKQVINKCKVVLEGLEQNQDENPYAQGRCVTVKNILQLFEIEECE